MRRGRLLAVLADAVAVSGAAALAAACTAGTGAGAAVPATVSAASSWGTAIEVPGLATLNKGGARVNSVSCASAGNCAAGGHYADRHGEQGFVAAERHGVWRRAIEVPSLAALNTGGKAEVISLSCASAGSCSAGGYYTDRRHNTQGFVAVETNGRWRKAIEVPGLSALNKGGHAQVSSVSCGAAGSCSAGGYYRDRHHHGQGFVAVERAGVWRRAIEVPGLGALNAGAGFFSGASVTSVSCGSAGSCVAGGDYTDRDGQEGFVAVERNGLWHKAIEVPGLATLNTGEGAVVYSVSCASAGSCAVGGAYGDSHGVQGFVADETNGVWATAIAVPGLAALNMGGVAVVYSVSCASAGNCAAGGYYSDRGYQGFVADETNGIWGTAIAVPGLAALNKGSEAMVLSVSCGAAGSCAAGGWYLFYEGFVAVETNGVWDTAIEVPGLAALNKGRDAKVYSVSCASAGNCAAGGSYAYGLYGRYQGFVADERGG